MDNTKKREVNPGTIPCHGASKYFVDKCVVAKKLYDNEYYKQHSSFRNIKQPLPNSPFSTQIPRPPVSNGRRPFMSYEPTVENPSNSVKSLPKYSSPSPTVRSLPQYPYARSQSQSSSIPYPNLILAKRKTRSNLSNSDVP